MAAETTTYEEVSEEEIMAAADTPGALAEGRYGVRAGMYVRAVRPGSVSAGKAAGDGEADSPDSAEAAGIPAEDTDPYANLPAEELEILRKAAFDRALPGVAEQLPEGADLGAIMEAAGFQEASKPGEGPSKLGLVDIIQAHNARMSLPAAIGRRKDGGILIPHEFIGSQIAAANAATAATNVPIPVSVVTWPLVRKMDMLSFLGVFPEPQEPGKLLAAWVNTSPPMVMDGEDATLASPDVAANALAEVELVPKRQRVTRGLTTEAEYSSPRARRIVDEDAVSTMAEGMTAQVINGDGTGENFSGLFGAARVIRAAPAAGTSIDTWATVVAAIEACVDGKYAGSVADLRCVVNPATAAFLGTLVSTPGGDQTARQYLNAETAGLRVSADAPAPDTSDGTTHEILIRRGLVAGAFIWPAWAQGVLYVETPLPAGQKWHLQVVSNFQAAGSAQGRDDWVKVGIRSVIGTG